MTSHLAQQSYAVDEDREVGKGPSFFSHNRQASAMTRFNYSALFLSFLKFIPSMVIVKMGKSTYNARQSTMAICQLEQICIFSDHQTLQISAVLKRVPLDTL